jgi:hypothetical protein
MCYINDLVKLAGEEAKQIKALKKIEALKESRSWSSKQIQRQIPPSSGTGHWDMLLAEMVRV